MQDRLTYANGNTITTEGFRCSVGEPIDIKVTVGEAEEVNLQGEAGKIITYGDYLITLEVNGEKAAYRDLYHFGEDTVTVGDYTISDDMYLDGVSEGDEVVMRIEPVELMVTDTFRAAVKSLGGSESSGGGSGGGVLIVNATDGDDGVTLDKTWTEIHNAPIAFVLADDIDGVTKRFFPVVMVGYKRDIRTGEIVEYHVDVVMYVDPFTDSVTTRFSAETENGVLTYVGE